MKSFSKKLLRGLLALGFSLLTSAQAWGEGEFLSSLERDVTSLVSQVKPSLVTINTIHTIKSKSNLVAGQKVSGKKTFQFEKISRVGSGVVFDREGHVITSASVVSGGDEFEVVLTDGRKLKGELMGEDLGLNLAVLKVDAPGLVPARFGNSDQLKIGSWIIVLGNSYGLPTAVAAGLFNGTRPDGFIQMSASVAPGNSGGPVLNSRGEVIGLVSAKVSEASSFSILTEEDGSQVRIAGSQGLIDLPSASISLALPSNQVKKSALQIIEHGSIQKGFLGVYLEETTNQEGIFVSDVVQESPAQKAGIKPGDVVVRFNGRKVGDTEAFRQLVEETPPQTVVPLKVQRDGNLLDLTVQMGEAQPAWLAPLPNLDFTSLSRLSKLKDWNVSEGQLATGLDAATKQASEQAVNQLLEQYKKMFETQKAASAYNTTKMEKRMAELERQVEEYKQALELLRQELQEVKASQAP